jgi:ABC-2 type transport system permease protein
VPVAVVDFDRSSLSRQLIRLADASPNIKVVFVANDTEELRTGLWSGDLQGGLIIPRGFRRSTLWGETVKPLVIGNGAYIMFNRAALLGFSGAIQALSSELDIRQELRLTYSSELAHERAQPVRLDLRAVSNSSGGYSTYVVPAIAVVVLQQTLLLGICVLMGKWRALGSPLDLNLRRNRLALVLAAATVCLVNSLYYVGLVFWREDYPRVSQLTDLLPVIVVFSLTAAAWAVAIGSWFRYRQQAFLHLLPTTIPMVFLAGFAWPIESIPLPLRGLSLLVPSTEGIQAFLKVNQMDASLFLVQSELLNLSFLLAGALLVILTKRNWPKVVIT